MKAEHRKELETNALADRMGRLLDNVKQKPQRGTVLYVLGAVFLVAVIIFAYRWYRVGKAENSDAWFEYYVGNEKALLETHRDEMQGKAVRFDRAWKGLWTAMTRLGSDPNGAYELLRYVAKEYEDLKSECENDPVLAPEAMYNLALIKETLTLDNRENLNKAIEMYEEVAKNYSASAYGQLAEKRLDALKDDDKRDKAREVYQDLNNIIRFDRKK